MTMMRINDADLYSEVAGSGEPVLMLHGGYCSIEHLRPVSDALVGDHEVFAFERPGHGRSADLDGPFSYTRGMDDTVAYLDAMGLDSAHVVGYSDGANIGLLLAIHHPDRVRSLTAISGNLDPSGLKNAPDPEASDSETPDSDPPDSEAGGDAPVERSDTEPGDEGLDPYTAMYNALSPDGPEHAAVVFEKLLTLWTTEPHIAPGELAAVTAPTLIVSADGDEIRVDHSLLIANSITGAQLCIVPGASHGLIDEKPEFVSAIVREFLLSVTGRSTAE